MSRSSSYVLQIRKQAVIPLRVPQLSFGLSRASQATLSLRHDLEVLFPQNSGPQKSDPALLITSSVKVQTSSPMGFVDLSPIFRFRHLPPPSTQSTTRIDHFRKLISDFLDDLKPTDNDTLFDVSICQQEYEDLAEVYEKLSLPFENGGPKWLPHAGCFLIVSPAMLGNSYSVRLSRLEKWEAKEYQYDGKAWYYRIPKDFVELPMSLEISYAESEVNSRKRLRQGELIPETSWPLLEMGFKQLLPTEDLFRKVQSYLYDASSSLKGTPLLRTDRDVEALYDIIVRLRSIDARRRKTIDQEFEVVARSKTVVCVWIATCLIHHYLRKEIPCLNEYRIPVNENDLAVLAVDDKRALDGLSNVTAYLRRENSFTKSTLFDFDDQKPTSQFALQVAKTSLNISQCQSKEKDYLNSLKEDYWKKVTEKKKRLVCLRSQRQVLQRTLHDAVRKTEEARVSLAKARSNNYYQEQTLNEATAAETRAESALHNNNSRIREANKQPPLIISALPVDENSSLVVLFFLLMEKQIDTMIQICFDSKLAKLPTSMSALGLSTAAKFNNPCGSVPRPNLTSFTPQLKNSSLQLAVSYPTDPHIDTMRGNEAYARQNEIPRESYTKNAFLRLFSLRAFPYQQIRKILILLEEVVRMALLQYGELSEGLNPTAIWKTELFGPGITEAEGEFERVLGAFADRLEPTPRDYRKLEIVAEIACFLAQFNRGHDLPSRFGSIAAGWGADFRKRACPDSVDQGMLVELRAKECLLCGLGIRALALGPLDLQSATLLAKLILKFNHTLPYASEASAELSKKVNRVKLLVNEAMVNLVDSLVKIIGAHPQSLTSALYGVVESVTSTLPRNSYYRNGVITHAFEASTGGAEYFIDLLTGAVLVNGVPPGRLPQAILNDPLYKRSFGKRNYEVVNHKHGLLETARLIEGHYLYRFGVRNGQIVIQEVDTDNCSAVELLELVGQTALGDELPLRLKELHTHWLDRKGNLLFFRGIEFNSRAVDFVAKVPADGRGSVYCHEVPKSRRSETLSKLIAQLDGFPTFVKLADVPNTAPHAMLKIERKEYIHMMETPTGTLICRLPRHKLNFERTKEQNGEYAWKTCRQHLLALPFFAGYLVLDRIGDPANLPSYPSLKLLTPDLKIDQTEAENNLGRISPPENPADLHIKTFIYIVDERNRRIISSSIVDRLHLAAIFIASSMSAVRNKWMGISGSEAAIELVRHSWINRSLSCDEREKVQSIMKCSDFEPVLTILCFQLVHESSQLSFLFGNQEKPVGTISNAPSLGIRIAEFEYRQAERQCIPFNRLRRGLMAHENTLNILNDLTKASSARNMEELPEVEISDPPVDDGSINNIECQLKKFLMLRPRKPSWRTGKIFPVGEATESTSMDRYISKDLKRSWDCSQQLSITSCPNLTDVQAYAEKCISTLTTDMFKLRGYIKKAVTKVHEKYSDQWCVLRSVNRVPFLGFPDIMRMAFDFTISRTLNPFLSERAVATLQSAGRLLLQLEVLNNKLERIKLAKTDTEVIRELETVRRWSVDEHPRWLVFEVEGRLQIRPEQYSIAQHLIDNPGAITQLNMGLGKTRVITPMLILHYCNLKDDESAKRLRVNILSSLLLEALNFLHKNLTASVLDVAIFQFPFTRQFVDIMDESDALLSHRYQLVYAVGDLAPLKDCTARVVVCQALLRVVNEAKDGTNLRKLLSQADFATVASTETSTGFKTCRLLPNSPKTKSCCMNFRSLLLDDLLRSPPGDLRWLTDILTIDRKAIIDPKKNLDLESVENSDHKACLLALRGFLAFGLLEMSLERRCRVDYGIDTRRKKRVAVPFRSCDQPAERSEWAHPDCAIFLTHLGYYYEGLTKDQVQESLVHLLQFGREAQRCYWDKFLKHEKLLLSQEEFNMISSVDKVDLANKFKVLPVDTAQYSGRIASNAWNLADGGHVIGFPGTKDNHLLLPLQVRQKEPDVEKLLATDGYMLGAILEHTRYVETLEKSDKRKTWEQLLKAAIEKGSYAVIDTGSLLAGVSNQDAAFYLVRNGLKNHFRGVCFFHQLTGWKILDRETDDVVGLAASHLHESETFVIFDEARSRGSDMRLKKDAVAILTLGGSTCKDKLMQGAGRLRMLGTSQKLDIVCTSDVRESIKRLRDDGSRITRRILAYINEINVNDVLNWVLCNTKVACAAGLSEWARQGTNFIEMKKKPDGEKSMTEDWSLETLYQNPVQTDSVDKFIERNVRKTIDGLNGTDMIIVEGIRSRGVEFGAEVEVAIQSNEECERELILEQELIRQEERKIEKQQPATEKTWNYKSVLDARSINDIAIEAARPLAAYVAEYVGHKMSVSFEKVARVHATRQFFSTIQRHASTNTKISYFLRPIDALYLLPNESIILLSEKEADAVLSLVMSDSRTNQGRFISFGHLCSSQYIENGSVTKKNVPLSFGDTAIRIDVRDTAALQLLDGQTTFGDRKEYVQELVNLVDVTDIRELVEARGAGHNWSCSDLEELCQLMKKLF
ncbi:hypothetical protein BJ742DRAFT_739966 [Cladochytrium replicatum]|nr:hypothetical protein BJ742DRAFT_739966 [Cladochytrium replicatum]